MHYALFIHNGENGVEVGQGYMVGHCEDSWNTYLVVYATATCTINDNFLK